MLTILQKRELEDMMPHYPLEHRTHELSRRELT